MTYTEKINLDFLKQTAIHRFSELSCVSKKELMLWCGVTNTKCFSYVSLFVKAINKESRYYIITGVLNKIYSLYDN